MSLDPNLQSKLLPHSGRRRWLWVPVGLLVLVVAALSGDGTGSPPLATGPDSATASLATTTTTHIASTTVPLQTTTTQAESRDDATDLFAPPTSGLSGDPEAANPEGAEIATVVSITDGDTIRIRFDSGIEERVRLIGINAPESGECFAGEAATVLGVLTPVGSAVAMTSDVSDRDQFGRLLRYLWVGGLHVNEEMVRRGGAIAREYPPDLAMAGRLRVAHEEAQAQGLGLWAPDACGPVAGTDLQVVELNADAPGNDHENLNGEWVRIGNQDGIAVDMTGWVLKDESAVHRYRFPDGSTLAVGAFVTVFTGCGADTTVEHYWCSQLGAVWNNDGDTAFLLDPTGNIVHSLSSR